jgi:hypothetical protein
VNRYPISRSFTACLLLILLGIPSLLTAQTSGRHIVSPADLQKEVQSASAARIRNVETISKALAVSTEATKLVSTNPAQLKAVVSVLNDDELTRLAARVDKAQADFAAGRITDRDLLVILVGIAALILIIVAVR